MSKICPSCGAEVADANNFCNRCGNPVNSATPVDIHGAGNYTSSTGADGFVNKTEDGAFSLKNGRLMNILSGEGFVKEDAVITNRRLYYSASVGIINKNSTEQIVDIDDITGTKITNYNPYALLVLAGIVFLVGLILPPIQIKLMGFIIALVFVVSFFVLKKAFIKIEYAGGCIHFSVKKYGLANVREFQRRIYVEKEKIRQSK